MKFPDNIEDIATAVVPVGSRITCNPPPEGTDQDLLVLFDTHKEVDEGFQWLRKRGWTSCNKENDKYDEIGEDFIALRKNVLNMPFKSWNAILTSDSDFFDRFLLASAECKRMNVLDKDKRIEVFSKFINRGEKKKPKEAGKWDKYMVKFNELNNPPIPEANAGLQQHVVPFVEFMAMQQAQKQAAIHAQQHAQNLQGPGHPLYNNQVQYPTLNTIGHWWNIE